MQTLDFTVNKLSGEIPNDITRLTELRTLALNDNKLGGTLPAELGKLTRLESLTLHNNSIRGRSRKVSPGWKISGRSTSATTVP